MQTSGIHVLNQWWSVDGFKRQSSDRVIAKCGSMVDAIVKLDRITQDHILVLYNAEACAEQCNISSCIVFLQMITDVRDVLHALFFG